MSLSASMKPDAFVFAERLAEGLAAARVIEGDIVGAPRLSEPAHAMRQARRRQPHLGIAKALADFAEHVAWPGRAGSLNSSDAVTAGETAVHRVHVAHDADARPVHVGQEHRGRAVFHARHDDRIAAPSAPVMNHLRPLMTVVVAVANGRRIQHRRIGARARRRLGHREEERVAPATSGRSQRSCCAGVRHFLHQVDVAFVRRVHVQRDRPERRVTRLFEHDRFLDVRKAEAAELRRAMRGQQAGATRPRHEILPQRFVWAVCALAWIILERHDFRGDEFADALLQVAQPGFE